MIFIPSHSFSNTPENHGFKESLRKDRISAATQPRPSSHSSHEDYPPLPPPLDDERLSPVSYPQQERGLNRSLSFDRKGANSSLQRAFSFGEAGVGVSEEVEDDDDEDLPVVDIDLRY